MKGLVITPCIGDYPRTNIKIPSCVPGIYNFVTDELHDIISLEVIKDGESTTIIVIDAIDPENTEIAKIVDNALTVDSHTPSIKLNYDNCNRINFSFTHHNVCVEFDIYTPMDKDGHHEIYVDITGYEKGRMA